MILTVLGNNGPFPAPGGACSSYLVESDSGDTRVLVDCGPGSLANLNRFLPPDELTAVILTHLHFDHMSDMLPMRYQLDVSPRLSLPVYAPDSPVAVVNMLTGGKLDLYEPEDGRIGEMRVSYIPAVHPVKSNCVCLECDGAKLVLTGDTNENPPLELFADGADLLVADAGFLEADWLPGKPHLSALRCGQLARSAGVKQLLLTHLNPKYDPQALLAEARTAYPNARLAEIGLRCAV